MATPSFSFLQLDALVNLPGKSDQAEGFERVPLTLTPPFDAKARRGRSSARRSRLRSLSSSTSRQVSSYTAVAPPGAASLSVCATSFSSAGVRICGAPGSLSTLAFASSPLDVAATLHGPQPGCAELARVTVRVTKAEGGSAATTAGEKVLIDTSAPAPPPAAAPGHGHSHGGVPCTKDHGPAAAAGGEKDGHGHGHAGHGHAHGEAKVEDKEQEHGHGHSHGGGAQPAAAVAPSHAHAHAHSHGGVACASDHGGDAAASAGDGYVWAQEEGAITVEVPVPAGTKAKDVAVLIGACRLDVDVCGKPVVHGALAGTVSVRRLRSDERILFC